MVAESSRYDDEKFHELVEMLLLAVTSGQFPDWDYVREAVQVAEIMSQSLSPAIRDSR